MKNGAIARVVILAGKLQAVGGIETHLFQFAKAMVERGHEVHLVVTSKNLAPGSVGALRQSSVAVSQFDCTRPFGAALGYLRCLAFLRSLRTSRSVLYSNGRSGFAYLAALFLTPRVWIHHHHSDVSAEIVSGFSRLYRRVLSNCDWLICCTPDHCVVLADSFKRAGKTICLPYLNADPSGALTSRRRRDPASGKSVVLGFFGRLRASKGVPHLLGLAEWFRQNDIECRLHGDDCERLLPPDLPDSITWMGPYDSALELDTLLSEVDFVVLPTTFTEGLPIVMNEAISRGVPIVAYDGGGLREMTGFHPGVMIISPEVSRLKAAILKMIELINDPALSMDLARAFKKRFSREITLEWWAQKLRS